MEVAIKMAMRLWDTRAKKGLIRGYQGFSDSDDTEDLVEDNMEKLVVLTQKDCYHGEISGINGEKCLMLTGTLLERSSEFAITPFFRRYSRHYGHS